MRDKGLDKQRMKKPAAPKPPKNDSGKKPVFALIPPNVTGEEILARLGIGAKKK
jgi:hypothetical protein